MTLPDETPQQIANSTSAHRLVQCEFEPNTWRFWLAVDGQPPVEIAAELGMSPAAVHGQVGVLHRLNKKSAT